MSAGFATIRRLAALIRDEGLWRRRLPFIPQGRSDECGVACLAMVASFFGQSLPLAAVRPHVRMARGAASAAELLRAAARLGLNGRAFAVRDLAMLRRLPRPAILHWTGNHFVVLESVDARGLSVIDPAKGTCRVAWADVPNCFAGVALVFEPSVAWTTERRRRLASDLAPLLSYVWAESPALTRTLGASIALHGFTLPLALLAAVVVDHLIPAGALDLLVVLGAGVVVLTVFRWSTAVARSALMGELRTRLDARITSDALDHLLHLPYTFFEARSSGDLLDRLAATAVLRESVTSAVFAGVLDGLMLLTYLVVTAALAPVLGIVATALMSLRLLFYILTRKRQLRLTAEHLARSSATRAFEVDTLAAIPALKAAAAEDVAIARWSALFAAELASYLRRTRAEGFVSSTLEALSVISQPALLLVGAKQVIGGQLSLGSMLAATALAGAAFGPFSNLVRTAFQFQTLPSYLDRVWEILREGREDRQGEQRKPPAHLGGCVAVRDLHFAYSGGQSEVLRGVSFTIEAGERVAIVGPSGAGKSTIVKLLIGFYRPGEGTIEFDGLSSERLDMRELRRQLGVVLQNDRLVPGTLWENLALGDEGLSHAAVEQAVRLAGLDDVIHSLPLGYDTVLSDEHTMLSGGEKQRLLLARALAKGPAVLLLDEALNALDLESETAILQRLRELQMTQIIIAHRCEAVSDVDRILVLDAGRIVEAGSHSDLVRNGGLYLRLAQRG